MGLFTNPISYAGYPPGVTGTPTTQNTTVRAATVAEAEAGVLNDVYITPYTMANGDAPEFASPPPIGSVTPNTGAFTTLSSTGLITAGTGLTATTGNIVASAGNISTTVGSISAATTLTAGTGITATTGNIVASTGNISTTAGSITSATTLTATSGNITASAGDVSATGNVIAAKSSAGATVSVQCTNADNTNTASNSQVQIAVGGTSGGSPSLLWQVSGAATNDWACGADRANSYRWCLSDGDVVGTTDALRVAHSTRDIEVVSGDLNITAGDLSLNGAASKVNVNVGTAATASMGTATLDGASPSQVVVSTTAVTASSKIFYTYGAIAGTPGFLETGTVVANTSFQIKSSANGDTSTVNYWIIN